MLKQLTINNYALIEHTDLSLDKGLSVITGETGAGKSIMLGALGMLLGQKADAQVLLDKEKKCVVEAEFDISSYNMKPIFDEAEVDYDDITIVRREIMPSGKARAFVNDTPVTVAFLKEIGSQLIDIHSQHQNMLLSQGSFHLDVVDAVARTNAERDAYADVYADMKEKERELKELKELKAKQGKELDYDRFILNELEKAELKEPNELAELERLQQIQDKAEDIKSALAFAIDTLTADEVGVLGKLNDIGRQMSHISNFLPQDDKVCERVEAARIDLDDLSNTLQNVLENVEFDPEEQNRIASRLNVLNALTVKHSVETVGDLIDLRDELRYKISSVDSFDDRVKELSDQLAVLTARAKTKADALTEKRKTVFDQITTYITSLLHEMGMKNARFIIELTPIDFTPKGCDDIHFLFAANKNGIPTDIAKVASGGEMSRVMLSIKSLLSMSKSLPTIIFDEIDTGVSGDVADKMGRIMCDMANHMQVLAISHLPQVAARGHKHYRVYKEDTDVQTISHIEELDAEHRVGEIAKMLSGATITDAALANAKELLASSK